MTELMPRERPCRAPDLTALIFTAMPFGLELISYQIDDWYSRGAAAQLHVIKLQVASGRLDELAATVARLEGQTVGAWCVLEAGLDDLGAAGADVHLLVTD